MDSQLIGLISIPFLLIMLVLRMHIGIALYLTGFLGYWLLVGDFNEAVHILGTQPYAVTATFTLTALPLFMLMGTFAGHAGFAADSYNALRSWIGGIRGGLAMATIGANAMFGAACGSSGAACVVFTKFSLPEMQSHGYEPRFACSSIVAAGTLAMLIPPSVLMIVYGSLTEQSIGRLFIGGIGPGLLLAFLYCVGVGVMVRVNRSLAPVAPERFRWKDKLISLRKVWGIAILGLLVLGGIYAGVFTPEEAGAVGACGAFIIALALRKLNRRAIMTTLRDAGRTNAMIFFLFAGAILYGRFLALSGLPVSLSQAIGNADMSPMLVLGVILVLYLALGCILDSISMVTLTIPVIFPISQAMGWDPIWFGVLVIVAMEVGLLTPPVGINVFVTKAAAGDAVTLEALFRSVIPFFIIMLVGLAILAAFPCIITGLPGLMMK